MRTTNIEHRRWGLLGRVLCAAAAVAFLTGSGCPGDGQVVPPIQSNEVGDTNSSNPGTSGGTASEAADHCVQAGSPASTTQQQMFDALNNYRVSKGLSRLVYSKVLETAATAHAVDMYSRSFFSHDNPDGKSPLNRATTAGFCRIQSIGENIAWNQQSVAEVQTGWQNSPGHNTNMMNTEYRYVGMGYYASPNGPYWVQLFGNVFPQ